MLMTFQTATSSKLTEAVRTSGIELSALADQSGISADDLAQILDGTADVTVADIESLAVALDVNPSTLVEFESAA